MRLPNKLYTYEESTLSNFPMAQRITRKIVVVFAEFEREVNRMVPYSLRKCNGIRCQKILTGKNEINDI